jgi:hypothetical protein
MPVQEMVTKKQTMTALVMFLLLAAGKWALISVSAINPLVKELVWSVVHFGHLFISV